MNYKLLPFNFHRLHDGDIVIVNFGGDYLFLTPTEFKRFIAYDISTLSELFYNLKGKHFLTDDNMEQAVKMLSIQYRSKKAFLSSFTGLHMVVITLRCNQKCIYCQVASCSSGSVEFDMTPLTAKAVVNMIFMSPSPYIKIEFQGGEPLLNWSTVEFVVLYALKKNRSYGKNLEFVICTNLLLINDKILHFIKKHNINLSTSLDGSKHIHDKYRNSIYMQSTYDRFIDRLALVKSVLHSSQVSALMTTSQYSLNYPNEIIDEYIKLGFSGVFLRALNPYGFAEQNWEVLGYGINDFLNFYFKSLDYIIELNKSGVLFVEFYASLLLKRILTPFSTGFMDLQSPAGAGISGVVYDFNGDVFPSDEARMLARKGDKRFLMGNALTHSYQALFSSKTIKELVGNSCTEVLPGCFSCAFQIFCGADPVRNYVDSNDVVGHRPSSEFCIKNQRIIEYLLIKIKQNDHKTMDVFWSWIK